MGLRWAALLLLIGTVIAGCTASPTSPTAPTAMPAATSAALTQASKTGFLTLCTSEKLPEDVCRCMVNLMQQRYNQGEFDTIVAEAKKPGVIPAESNAALHECAKSLGYDLPPATTTSTAPATTTESVPATAPVPDPAHPSGLPASFPRRLPVPPGCTISVAADQPRLWVVSFTCTGSTFPMLTDFVTNELPKYGWSVKNTGGISMPETGSNSANYTAYGPEGPVGIVVQQPIPSMAPSFNVQGTPS